MKITALPYTENSEPLFEKFVDLEGAVWLDSGKPLSNMGRYDIISALPSEIAKPTNNLDLRLMQSKLLNSGDSHELPFVGGWIGHFPYSFNHKHFKITGNDGNPAWFGWYPWAIVVDHLNRRTDLVVTDQCSKQHQDLIQIRLDSNNPIPTPYSCSDFSHDLDKADYLAALAKIKQYLVSGDCYQINFSQRFSAQIQGSAYAAYKILRKQVPSPFSAFVRTPDETLLSISPERFIQIHGKQAMTQPIKGTIGRHHDPEVDHSLRDELQRSEKNRAENVMIVDLLRNDFSQHCRPHSVKVKNLFEVQSFANVHHLVSTITGVLESHVGHVAFISDCFPGGSITGAPKKRAIEIIEELEKSPRGPYCGSIGYFSCNNKTDFNIAIRTLQIKGNEIHAWAGGGIVFDSDPEEEYQECLTKIMALLNSLN